MAIVIGSAATDRPQSIPEDITYIEGSNPANEAGVITSVEIWANANLTGCVVGTFYATNGLTFKCRDSESVGAVTSGSKQEFSVTINVQIGDYIGIYFSGGELEADIDEGAGGWYVSGEYIDPNDETTYTLLTNYTASLYGSSAVVTSTSTSSTTSTSTSTSTSSSTTTTTSTSSTTTLAASAAFIFGEENPTEGETPIEWSTWSDGAAGSPTIIGDADWGKLQLAISAKGLSAVYDFGSAYSKFHTLTENEYGSGQGNATIYIRGQAATFNQDDANPAWEEYTGAISKDWRYMQVKVEK